MYVYMHIVLRVYTYYVICYATTRREYNYNLCIRYANRQYRRQPVLWAIKYYVIFANGVVQYGH